MKKKEEQQHYYTEAQLDDLDALAELKAIYTQKILPPDVKKKLLGFIRALRASIGKPVA
jgi:5'-3' exonuclease